MVFCGGWGLGEVAKRTKTLKLWYMAPGFGVYKGLVVVWREGVIFVKVREKTESLIASLFYGVW